MDFVVFGFGVSALLMLGGFGLRDLGPWLFGAARRDEALPEFEDAKATIRKQTLASVGNAVSAAGAGVAFVTIAALLGKTTDEIGAIVVGVAIVLGTVGVAAWSYDILRRYRSAMDIVTAQEDSVRTRIQARDARDRALRPNPQTTRRPAPKAKPVVSEPEAVAAEAVAEPEPLVVEEEEIDLDAPLPDWHPRKPAADRYPEPLITPASDEGDLEPVSEEAEAELITPAPPAIVAESPATVIPTTPQPSVVTTAAPRTTPPPVFDDALIDEAVRIEPVGSRFSTGANTPSWLFDDLETDLEQQGSAQDDPLDRFGAAKPVSRPSALERLLAEDRARADRGKKTDRSSDDEPES